jgi:hypothetical protein
MLKTFDRLLNLTSAIPANTWVEVLNTNDLPLLVANQPHSIFLVDFRLDAYLTSTLTPFTYAPSEGQTEQEQLTSYLTALRDHEALPNGSIEIQLGKSLDNSANYLLNTKTVFVNPGYPTTQDLVSAITSGTERYLQYGARLAIKLSRQLVGTDLLVVDISGTLECPNEGSVVVYSP